MSTFPPRAGGGGCCLFLEVSFLLSANQSSFYQFQNLIHYSVQKSLVPVWHKLISKKQNVKQDHKGMNETWIFWLIPFAGHGLSQIWASIHLHVYFPYLRNVFMGWGGLSGRYLSCLEVGLSISGYSLLLLFYVFFFQF